MRTSKSVALAALLFSTQLALADASYQTTSQVTGGSFIDTLRSNPFSAKLVGNMLAPTTRIIMVHGNQKAEVTKESTEITDLDKEVIIHMDNEKKTYTVTTFAQLRQAFADMSKQVQQHPAAQPQPQPQAPQSDLKISFDVSVKNTGATKVVNGLSAQEQIITVKMICSNPNATASTSTPGQPSSITYVVTTDVWIAPDPPELKQIQDFDVRMGQKLMAGVDLSAFAASMRANANAGMSQMFAGQPGSADAMAQMRTEMAKIKGTHVLEITSMGGDVPAQPGAPSSPAPSNAPSSSGSVAGQVATDTATQTASSETGHLGVVGSALGNSVLSAFKRKKSTPPPAPAPTPAAPPAAATPTQPATTHVTMMEMTQQETNFSTEAVPASVFQVPANYKKVASPMQGK